MEDVPPSYESATARDAWAIIAQYIPSSDLCAASLVCRRWHQLFLPFLWGDPASHFGSENDAVYGSADTNACTLASWLTGNSGPNSVQKDLEIRAS